MNAEQTALDAYLARTAAIHWGHVGDRWRVEAGLDELLAIFGGDDE